MAAEEYYEDSPAGPTGVPDPNNPGYDTAGYPLSLDPARTQPPVARVPPPNNVPVNGAPNTTQPPPPATTGAGLIDLFPTPAPAYQAPPGFVPPGYTPPPAFKDPTAAEAAAEPGYAFGLKTGLSSVEAAAAARGVLNSGGTLKDIFDYGNNAASQNYQNVDNRARSNYLLNYQTQYTDPYAFAYKSAADAATFGRQDAGMANTMNFNNWLQSYNIFRNRQRDTIDANTATA